MTIHLTAQMIKELAEYAGFTVTEDPGMDMEYEYRIEQCPEMGVLLDDKEVAHYEYVVVDVEVDDGEVHPLGKEIKPRQVYVPIIIPEREDTANAQRTE